MGYSFIERPEARYKIIYGSHNRTTPASELPPQYDALFLEGGWRYSESKIGDGHLFQNMDQYSEIVENAQEREAKIYFGDIPLRKFPLKVRVRGRNLLPDWPAAIRVGEFYSGIGLAILLAKEINQRINQRKEISRRDLLRMVGEGTVAAWGMSWFSKLGSIFIKERKEVPRILEKMISAEDSLHPEFLSVLFRNAVAAKKLITIGKREQTEHNRRAELAIVFGAGHTGLAEFLRRGEEACKKVVRLYPQGFLKAMIEQGNLDYLSLIIGAKFSPQHGLWVVTDRFHDEGLYFSVSREQEYHSARKEIR